MKQLCTFIFLAISIVTFGQNTQIDSIRHTSTGLANYATPPDSQYDAVMKLNWRTIKPLGRVSDFEKLFTQEEIEHLENLITLFDKTASIEIAVVTIDANQVDANHFDEFALFLAQYWQAGKKEKNNGILIALSKVHRKIRICNGYGIEKIMTDEDTKKIIDSVSIPYLKQGNYFTATLKSVQSIIDFLTVH